MLLDVYAKIKGDLTRGYPAYFRMPEEGIERPRKTHSHMFTTISAQFGERFKAPQKSEVKRMLSEMPEDLLELAMA
jgi:hypothetical protein